jgi:small subunit ribosomal protein S27Ae
MPKAEKEEKEKEKAKEGKAAEKTPAKEAAAKAPAKEAEAPTEEAKEEAKKPAKGKIQKKKKIDKKIYTIYKIEGETVSRLRPFCERCGPGYFMADHGNRFACGHCGFTRYKVTEPTQ